MDSESYDSWELDEDEYYTFHDDSSGYSSELDDNDRFYRDLPRVRNNDPNVRQLANPCADGSNIFQNMTNEDLEDIGRDISNNTHLERLSIVADALGDEKLSSLFRGLTKSSSVVMLELSENDISAAGLISLEPFIHNSINLRELDVSYNDIQTEGFNILMRVLRDRPIERLELSYCEITSIEIENAPKNLKSLNFNGNNIQSEGFNLLLRSLRDSSIEDLSCRNCGIESIDIVNDSLPRSLKELDLTSNSIDSNGCYEIANLLQEGGIKLEHLILENNSIDDEGVAILVDALKTNTSLKYLNLEYNDGISRSGRIMMLKLLNDISSIKATLQSNHTLTCVFFGAMNDDIFHYTNMATAYNGDSVRAGSEKVIQTQLHSQIRTELVEMQGVQSQSVYGEIDPLHLPEVLSLVSREHGQDELYFALKASIAEVITDHCG